MPLHVRIRSVAATAAFVFAATACLGAGLSAADAVKARQQHFKDQGGAAKALGEQFKSGAPDPAIVKAQAATLAQLVSALPTWFPAGSGPEAGVKTRALPLIWSDAPGFSAAARNLAVETAKLNTLAASGDMAAAGTQMQAVGAACGGCHKKYRGPET
ncbi:MAG TPA: cytochrome c [Caulobacteraceae bacterium]